MRLHRCTIFLPQYWTGIVVSTKVSIFYNFPKCTFRERKILFLKSHRKRKLCLGVKHAAECIYCGVCVRLKLDRSEQRMKQINTHTSGVVKLSMLARTQKILSPREKDKRRVVPRLATRTISTPSFLHSATRAALQIGPLKRSRTCNEFGDFYRD